MTEKLRDHISTFHDNGLYIDTKTIDLFGEIDFDMKDKILKNLHSMDTITSMITIRLSSEGGCVTNGLDIYDAIRALKNQVRIIAYGEVASMASVIFQAADQGMRYMMPNSYLMIHEGEQETKGRFKDRKEWEKLVLHQEEVCNNIYLKKIKEKKPRYTKAKFKNDFLEHDKILLPKEAISYGLADEILDVY